MYIYSHEEANFIDHHTKYIRPGKVAHIASNVTRSFQKVRNIGSIVYAMSGDRKGSSSIDQKMQEIKLKFENNFYYKL